jgi:tetratricopeptide (TPR) repeat protein
MTRRLLLLVCLGAGTARAGEIETVDALVEAGHFKRANAMLRGLVAAQPNDARLQYRLAQCQEAFGDLEGALRSARRAAELDPRSAAYRMMVATALVEKAQRGSGLSALSTARSAKAEAEAALRLDPRSTEALRFLVEYCFEAPGIAGGSKDRAAKLAEQIAAIDPAKGWLARAHLLPPRKEPAKAEQDYRKALEADPHSYEAAIALAQHYWRQKNYGAGETAARAAIQMHPERIAGYEMLARVDADASKIAELEATLAASTAAVPDNLSPYYFAARRLLLAGGDANRAQAWLRKYLSAEPEGDAPSLATAHWQLGLALEKAGRKPEAVAELRSAVQMDGTLKDARQDLKRLQ